MLEKLQNSQNGHSDSIQTTLVGNIGKVAKQPKLAILNQFRTLQYENTGKVAKQPKLAILNQFRTLQYEILEKLQNSQNWPF